MSAPARVASALRALRDLAAHVADARAALAADLSGAAGAILSGGVSTTLTPMPGVVFATVGPAEPMRPGRQTRQTHQSRQNRQSRRSNESPQERQDAAARPLFTLAADATAPQRGESVAAEDVPTTDPADTRPIEAAGAVPVDAEHVEIWTLVQRAQSGDGEAFGALYDRYVDLVYRFIVTRVHDRALAEDFTSETFLRALRRISTFSYQGRDVGAWFITIARNIVFDHAKSARFRLEVTLPDLLDGDETAPSPEAAVLDAFDSSALRKAIGELNDEQRECIVLRFLQGLSVSETAAAMGKNEGAVKALQYRAVKRLAILVGDTLR